MTTDKRHQKQAQEKEPLGYASLQSYDSQRPAWFNGGGIQMRQTLDTWLKYGLTMLI